MLLKSIRSKDNVVVELSAITALVGLNNSGKSECLRDIHRLLSNREPLDVDSDAVKVLSPRVLSEVRLVSSRNADQMLVGLQLPPGESDSITTIQGLNSDLRSPFRVSIRKDSWRVLARPDLTSEALRQGELVNFMPLRLAYCPLSTRMNLASSTQACSPIAAPMNLLQLLQTAPPSVHDRLSSACREVFGLDVRLDTSERVVLTLRAGESIPAEPADPLEAIRMYSRFPRVDQEGDGLRNFVGTVLALLLLPGRAILLDQPEAYLHPNQAARLAAWMARNVNECSNQVVCATHSVDFVQGLSSIAANVAVVRLFRKDQATRFVPLPTSILTELASSPLFAGQHALASVFREGVVLTMADPDRIMYGSVAAKTLGDSQTSFLLCHDCSKISSTLKQLRSAGVPACATIDLSLLAAADKFAELVEAATGAECQRGWLRIRQKLADLIEGRLDEQAMAESTQAMEEFLVQFKRGTGEASQNLVRTNVAAITERWRNFNREGIACLPRELRLWVQEMIEELKRCGLFISSKGTVDNWFSGEALLESTDNWFTSALTRLGEGRCPMELKVFVSEMLQYVSSSAVPVRPARLSNRT